MRSFLHRLRHARRGNVALITALVLIPLIGVASLAIDIGNATAARAQLDSAADAAALAASTLAANQYEGGNTNPVSLAQSAATARFKAAAGSIPSVTVSAPAVKVVQSGSSFTTTVAYTGSYATALARVLSVASIPLNGTSTAAISVNPYVDIEVLMDVSSSMSIAATTSDINKMQSLAENYVPPPPVPSNVDQGQPCAFACHWNTTNTDYWALAHRNNVELRIDVLSAAVGNLISTIASLNKEASFRLGLSTFNASFSNIYPMSTSITGASTALSQIMPDINVCSSNCPETYFTGAMTSVGTLLGSSGNGSSQATSQKYLFVVTDGLVDQMTGNNRVIGPITPSDCQALKNKGVTILTLYTPYLPLPTNAFYMQYVWPYQNMSPPDQIQQAMTSCASAPNYAFTATDATDINQQLQTMLAVVVQTSAHLTH